MFSLCSREVDMIRVLVQETAALASIALFVAMIGLWAGVITGV